MQKCFEMLFIEIVKKEKQKGALLEWDYLHMLYGEESLSQVAVYIDSSTKDIISKCIEIVGEEEFNLRLFNILHFCSIEHEFMK